MYGENRAIVLDRDRGDWTDKRRGGGGGSKKQEPMQNIKYNINAPSQREDWPYATHSILLTGRYSTPHLAALPLPYPTLDFSGCCIYIV